MKLSPRVAIIVLAAATATSATASPQPREASSRATVIVASFNKSKHLDGALLTGTKVYGDGSSSRFEGVFINRTSSDNPQDAGTTTFGLGVLSSPIQIHGLTVERLFYQRAR